MLLLVDSEEVAAMGVFDDLAVGDLDVFKNLDLVVDDCENLEARGKTYSQEKPTGVH